MSSYGMQWLIFSYLFVGMKSTMAHSSVTTVLEVYIS